MSASTEFGVGLTSTMPMPPARSTSADFATRSNVPRSHSTILPAVFAGASTPGPQRAGVVAPAAATDAAVTNEPVTGSVTVIDDPANACPSPSWAVASKLPATVLAATVVIHGDALSRVDAPGPELPAEAATKMPALAAPRNALSVAENVVRADPPPME